LAKTLAEEDFAKLLLDASKQIWVDFHWHFLKNPTVFFIALKKLMYT
jgi:hypothetical protein